VGCFFGRPGAPCDLGQQLFPIPGAADDAPASHGDGVAEPARAKGGGVSDTYDTDIVTWSERQAELLRRMGKGERVNEAG
jgi:hypothetical protein